MSVAVTFTPPGNSGGSPITSYTVTSTPGSHTASGPSSEITVSGLTNGTSYTFTVHATNAIGDSAESAASNAVIPGAAKPVYFNILSTGQSLALGLYATPAISMTQPYNNLMLSSSVDGTAAPLIPLVETLAGPTNVETISSGMANSLFSYDSQSRPVAVNLHGLNGAGYDLLKKGTAPYIKGIAQSTTIKSQIETVFHGTYLPIGVTAIHGEHEYSIGQGLNYKNDLIEWQADYENDLNALNGSDTTIPLFINQMNAGWTGEVAVAQLNAHVNDPGKVILVEPKYQYHYRSDLVHIDSNTDEKHMGEMFAKSMKKVILDDQTWDPLMPSSVIRTGNIITLSYHIPVGKLAIDTSIVAARPNYGFEFTQTGGNSVSISSVELTNNDNQIKITLNDSPTGSDQHVRYAWSCYSGSTWCAQAGSSTSVGGNIRDTDSSVSPEIGSTGLPLYDWGVTFDEPVALDTTAPSTPGTPSTTSPTNNSKPTWTWTTSTDSDSGLANPAYSVQWCGNSGFTGCDTNTSTSNTNSFTQPSSLNDGTWYFRVKAIDLASNSSSYSSNGSVVIDASVAPTPTPPSMVTSTATPTTEGGATATPTSLSHYLPWATGTTVPLSASFTTIPADLSNIELGQTITFDATLSGSNISIYEWNFGDGDVSNETKVEHKYETPGRYTVALTITDKSDNKSTMTKTVDVMPPVPTISDIKPDGTSIIFEGKSFPKTTVSLTIHSDPYTGQAIADKDGNFSYVIENGSETLGEGDHTVLASAAIILSDNTELKSKDSKIYDFKVSVDDGKLKVEMGKTKTWKIVSSVLGGIIIIGLGAVVLRRKRRGIGSSVTSS
jgi:PKD repeat protein